MAKASVPIFPLGPTAAATVLFRENGVTHVTAVVKATFAFSAQSPMRPVQPEPIFAAEAHRFDNPSRSIVATSDLAPRIPAADVLLLGHAHAAAEGVTRGAVRLAVGRGSAVLLDKTVHVVGDRRGSAVEPFRSIPLVYEKAFGGPGFRDNPLGTGALAGDPPPNLIDPAAPQRVVGFGPISRSWPARASLLSREVRAALDEPIAEIAPGFDFGYFHAAPPDQRVARLAGDEWIVLEGAHAERPRIQLQLPGAQALLRVAGTEADGRVFSLRADTLRIDADAERCTLVWRGAFPVRPSDLGALRLLAGLALPGAPVEWPAHIPYSASAPVPAAAPAKQVRPAGGGPGFGGTILIEDADAPPADSIGTIELSDRDIEVSLADEADFAATMPFAGKQAPGAPAPPEARARRGPDANEMTLDLSGDAPGLHGDAMPFAGPAAVHIAAERASGPIPGSPFGAPGGAPVPSPAGVASPARPPSNEASITLEVVGPDAPELPSEPVAPPVPAPAAPEPRREARSPAADPYGQNLHEAPPPAAPPPAATRPEAPRRPDVRGTLYRGFRR